MIRNSGWETSVSWRDRVGEVDYSVAFNLSDNKNEVVDLADTGPFIDGRWLTAEGYSLGTMWGYEALGLFVDQAEVDSHAEQTGLSPLTGPGDIKFRDVNGDGVINPDDRTVIGNDLPRYTLGTNLSARYKGFDINVFFQGVLDVDAYIEGALTEGPVWENFTTVEWLDRWTEENPNPDATRPKPSLNQHQNHGPISSFWVQDASYIKVKSAQIGYTIRRSPAGGGLLGGAASFLPFFDFDQVRFYVSGKDLFTFANEDLFLDPEFPSGRGTVYPQTRVISFGTSSGIDFILIRYADVLLMYAEAKIELNQIDGSVVDAINQVRTRGGMPALAGGMSQVELRDAVRYEQRIEFAMEGLRVFDLRRWKMAEHTMPGQHYGIDFIENGQREFIPTDNRLFDPGRDYLWPVPIREIELNPNITQNAGY